MKNEIPTEVTRILRELAGGEEGAWERLLPLVYAKLREVAGRYVTEGSNATLHPTALVHEAYAQLSERGPGQWSDQAHFLAVAAISMRHILVDHARQRLAEKRGGGWQRTTLSHLGDGEAETEVDLLDLDAALTALGEVNERQARIVSLRFFGGLRFKEIAETLGVSLTTVESDWRMARAWLSLQLRD